MYLVYYSIDSLTCQVCHAWAQMLYLARSRPGVAIHQEQMLWLS